MLADTVPLYPLYALLFADTGLSESQISALFVLWSTVAVLTEVPSGALADRYSRRAALVAAGVLQAAGYVVWITFPGFVAFAAGFVLWGLGGSLVSGAQEALLYDGLAAVGAQEHYARIQGRVAAVGLLAQVPAAVAATALFAAGGYTLAGWASVGCCLAAAALATRLPEPARHPAGSQPGREIDAETGPSGTAPPAPDGYLATMRAGLREATIRPAVRNAVLAVAVLDGLDAIEEYFPLLAHDWGVPTAAVPLLVLGIPLAGAAGAALGGAAASRFRPAALGLLLGLAAAVLGLAGLADRPAGLVGVGLFYALYQVVLVVADARMQERIEGTARATVTSVAGIGTEVAGIGFFAAWALGSVGLVAVLGLLVALALPWWLRERA